MMTPIRKCLHSQLARFLGDRRGNVAILTALLATPALAITGAAVDFSRALSAKSELSMALDSALLSLASKPQMEDQNAVEFVTDYVNDTLAANAKNIDWAVSQFVQTPQSVEASLNATVATSVLGILNLSELKVHLTSQVTRENKKVEVALVLDNTGSMGSNGKIGALREATHSLLDILFAGSNAQEMVKVAMVPFVTSVNIKADNFDPAWIDTEGEADNNGVNFSPATSHSELYDAMGVTWKGCVEARPEPYDTSDTAPTPSNKNTLWVEWLWPDEPDNSRKYANSYLRDGVSGSSSSRQRSITKYYDYTPSIDETAPYTKGPNKSCPQPLRPLTNDESVLRADTDQMTSWGSSGTNIALGLAWGWRVLSPGKPFTEGVAYDDEETEKALVLLTDGQNVVVSQNTHNKSDYNGYNYLSVGNLGTQSTWTAVQKVNAKVQTLCNAIKDKGVRIYTVTFQLNDETLKQIFRDCATVPSNYFDSPTNDELKIAFQSIAVDLSNLRISK